MYQHRRANSGSDRWRRTVATSRLGSNVYVLDAQDGAIIIDAGHPRHAEDTARAVENELGGAPVRALIITHSHADHVGAAAALKEQLGCEIWAHPIRRNRALAEEERRLALVPRPFKIDRHLTHGECIDLGDDTLHVVHTPGHAADHIALFLDRRRLLFCGDMFGFEDIGTVDITQPYPRAIEAMLESVQRCSTLDPSRVYPGHGPVDSQPARLFTTVRRRIQLFRKQPSILLSHTLMPLLLLLIESRGEASLAEIHEYSLSHSDLFGAFLDGMDKNTLTQELSKMLVILAMKGLIVLENGTVYLSSASFHQAA